MKITAIIQARMGSIRLPQKVMMDILGKPMIWHVINRVKHSKMINEIILATSVSSDNKPLLALAKDIGIKCYSGSENDVLDRCYQAAKENSADVVVRVTGDCPLIDPEIIDRTLGFFLAGNFDYVSTGHISSEEIKSNYPDGLDTEVFNFKSLERAWKEAKLSSEREHVTPYIWKHPEIFNCKSLECKKDYSKMRWTVDEEKDLNFVREVYSRLYGKKEIFFMQDILDLLEQNPEIMLINSNIGKDSGYYKSLKGDKEK